MNKIKDAHFMAKFPPALKKDETMSALGQIIAEELHLTANETKKNIIYANIEGLSEKWLDVLAYDLHVDWYDYDYPIEIKRAIIKDSVKVHQKFGTKYAVETALRNICKDAKISEWFEYGGRPFCFRATIGIEVSQEEVNDFLKYLKVVKNIRSWLDAIIYTMIIDHRNLESIILHNILFKMQIPFLGAYLLNGTRLLDGSMLLDSRRRYDLRMGLAFLISLGTDYLDGSLKLNGTRHLDDRRRHSHNLCMMFLSRLEAGGNPGGAGNFSAGLVFAISFGNRYLDGSMELDGTHNLDDKKWYSSEACITFLARLGAACLDGTHNMDNETSITFLSRLESGCQDDRKKHIQNVSTIYLAGMKYTDGKRKHSQSASIKFSAAIEASGNIGNATVIKHRNTYYFDGSELFDGSRQLNAFYKKEGI